MSLHKVNGGTAGLTGVFSQVCLVSMCCPASTECLDGGHRRLPSKTPNSNANLNLLILCVRKSHSSSPLTHSPHTPAFQFNLQSLNKSPPTPNPLCLLWLRWVFPLSQVGDFVLDRSCNLLQSVAELHFLGCGVLLKRCDDLMRRAKQGWKDGWRGR